MNQIQATKPAAAKIRSFTDLNAWKKGHELVCKIYDITGKFPSSETYALTDQLRRASISVTSNIAEGFRRKTRKDKIQFYRVAHGSLNEIQNQILIAKDVGYLDLENFTFISENTIVTSKLLHGLIKATNSLMTP